MTCLPGKKTYLVALAYLAASLLLPSCAYLEGAARQSEYSRIQAEDPSQRNLKHMIDRQSFFVYGRILDEDSSYTGHPIAVLAYSHRYENNELVDAAHVALAGTQYALHLPDGQYDLLVLADANGDGFLDQTEVVGRRDIDLSEELLPDKVASNVDIRLSAQGAIGWDVNIPVPGKTVLQESVFLPKGSIRHLGDPLFEPDVSVLGMYEPAAFLEIAPTMFYALEEDSYKTAVVFVHGIGGSARDFAPIVEHLDRDRFKPWFFYYPSGSDLNQLAEVFYNIFLSGNAAPLRERPMVIVAHSMGGLIVREVLNNYEGHANENRVALVMTIASPLGGHPAAAAGERNGGLVLPSWRDLNPDSEFVKLLFRKSLPAHVNYQLLYAYGNPGALKLGENSDGVVPLSSQLRAEAQRDSTIQFGFNNSHVGVLEDPDLIHYVIDSISKVEGVFPDAHIEVLLSGGYDVELDDNYNDREKYFIRKRGNYLAALARGELDTNGDPLIERFVQVARGKAVPETDAETAWMKFTRDFPQSQ